MSGNAITLQAPTSGGAYSISLPTTFNAGDAGDCVKVSGSGQLSFANCVAGSGGGTGAAVILNKDSSGPSQTLQASAGFSIQNYDYTSGNYIVEGPSSTSGSPADLLQFQDNSGGAGGNGAVTSAFSSSGQYLRIDYPSTLTYSTGTIAQSGAAITGVGTNFGTYLNGATITYKDGTTGIVTFVTPTALTSTNTSENINDYSTGYITQPGTTTLTGGGGASFSPSMVGDVIVYGDGSTDIVASYISSTQLTTNNTHTYNSNEGYTLGPTYSISTNYPGALTIGNSTSTTASNGLNLGGDTEIYRSSNGVIDLQSTSNGFTQSQPVTLQAAPTFDPTQTVGGLNGTTLNIAGGNGTGSGNGGSINLVVYAPANSAPSNSFVSASSGTTNGVAVGANYIWYSQGYNLSVAYLSNGGVALKSAISRTLTGSGGNANWRPGGAGTATGAAEIADCNSTVFMAANSNGVGYLGDIKFSPGGSNTPPTMSSINEDLYTFPAGVFVNSVTCVPTTGGGTIAFWSDSQGYIGYIVVSSGGVGSTTVPHFVQPTSAGNLGDVAADTTGTYVYFLTSNSLKQLQRVSVACVAQSGCTTTTVDTSYQTTTSTNNAGIAVNSSNVIWTSTQNNTVCYAPLSGLNNKCTQLPDTTGTTPDLLPPGFGPNEIGAGSSYVYFGSAGSNNQKAIARYAIGGTSANSPFTAETISGTNGSATFNSAFDSTNAFQINEARTSNSASIPLLIADSQDSLVSVLGQLSQTGGISTASLGTVSTPTVASAPCQTKSGETCTTTYTYAVTAVNASGGSTLPATSTITNGPSAANISTYPNKVTWSTVPGAATYNVYRTAGSGLPTGLIATVSANDNTSFSITDDGSVAAVGAVPSVDTSGQLVSVGGGGLQVENSDHSTVFSVTPAATPNLLSNGDFENGKGINGWGVKTFNTGSPPTTTTIVPITTQAEQGTTSMQISASSTANEGAYYNYSLVNGNTYTLNFYAKASGSSNSDLMVGYQGSVNNSGVNVDTVCTSWGSPNGSPSTTPVSTSVWQLYSCTFNSVAISINNPDIFIETTGTGAETYYIDGVQLVNGSTAPSSFDSGNTIQINGTINTPVSFQNSINSTAAFQIQDSSSNTLFKVNTTNDTVAVALSTTLGTTAVCSNLANNTTPTAGTAYTLEGCTTPLTADYAESYPVASDASYGDIVATGSTMVNTYGQANGAIDYTNVIGQVSQLVKSTSPYQTNTIGIVSNNYNAFTSAGDNINPSDNPMPIALNGRVPVNVASDSAAIAPGDYLTTSDQPGKAMKATGAGYVIGKALAAWDPSSGQTTVMVYVEPGYYPGPTQASYIQNGGSAALSSLNITGSADFNNINVSGTAVLTDLQVQTVEISSNLKVSGLTSVGNIQINGHIITGGNVPIAAIQSSAGSGATVSISGTDTIGTITITTGSDPTKGAMADILFSNSYGSAPHIVLSPSNNNAAGIRYYKGVTTTKDFLFNTLDTPAANTSYQYDYFIAQ